MNRDIVAVVIESTGFALEKEIVHDNKLQFKFLRKCLQFVVNSIRYSLLIVTPNMAGLIPRRIKINVLQYEILRSEHHYSTTV